MDMLRQTITTNLAEHAAPARERMALTLEAVEKLTGISKDIVSSIERNGGYVSISVDELQRLAEFLGLDSSGCPRPKPRGFAR